MRTWTALTVLMAASSLLATEAFAQNATATPDPDDPLIESGVTSYPPEFFAEYRLTSASATLSFIPGFSPDFGGNARGFAGNAGNILIDGRRPPSGNDGIGSVLGRIPFSAVERVDIVRGGAPGIDMQGHAVVANFILKQDVQTSGAISVNANSSPRGDLFYGINANVRRQNGERVMDASGNYFDINGKGESEAIRREPGQGITRQATGESEFISQDFGATGSYELPMLAGQVRVNGQYSSSSSENTFSSDVTIPDTGVESVTGSGESEGGELGLRYTRELESGLHLQAVTVHEINENQSESRSNQEGIDFISRSDRRNGQSVVTGTATLPAFGKWTIDGGGEVAYNWFETSSEFIVDGVVTGVRGDVLTVDEIRTELFGTASWTISPTLSAQFGLRYEYWTIAAEDSDGRVEKSLGYLKPRASMAWRPHGGHEYSLSVERQISQLSFGDFAVNLSPITGVVGVSNTDIEPEKTWLFEGRYEFSFANRGSFVAQITHRQISDVLGRTIIQGFDITANLDDESRTFASVQLNLPLHRWGWDNTWVSARVAGRMSRTLDPVTDEYRRVSNETPFEWSLGIRQERNNRKFFWNASVSGREGSTNYSPRSVGFSNGSVSVNGSVSWRPRDDISFGAGLNGSFGESENFSTFYQNGRDTGVIRWTTESQSPRVWQFSVNARRQF